MEHKMTREQIAQFIEELKDGKNLGITDARIADDCITALNKLQYTTLPQNKEDKTKQKCVRLRVIL